MKWELEINESDSDQSKMMNNGISDTKISDSKPRDLILFDKFFFVPICKLKYDCY